jgi:hypothetical protein
MALSDVTPAYVNLITNSQYTTRTADSVEFPLLRDVASVYLNESAWPADKYKLGVALMMAHYYALWGGVSGVSGGASGGVSDTQGGPVSSESVGNVSRGYGVSSSSSSNTGIPTEWLSLTNYGKQWLLLMRSIKAAPTVTGTDLPVSLTFATPSYP